jgi:DegV family protein with EDD domain
MSLIRVVTDTTASLPPGFAAAHQVEVVPQVVLFGEISFLEERTLSYAEFIRRLKAAPELPKTAAPETRDFVAAYGRQLAAAPTLLSIHPSSDVSGTVRSAQTAKDAHFPQADIRILDTRTVAGNLGTLVQLAVQWAEAGDSADHILMRLQALIPRGRTYFLVATLEYLRRGGRIGGAQAWLGSLLQIKPILELRAGRVEPLERVRTHHAALERLKELVIESCPRSPEAHLCVMHADAEAEAQTLAADLQKALGLAAAPLYEVGASITTHAGPGTLGVGFFA